MNRNLYNQQNIDELYILQPDNGEQALGIVETLVPKAEINGDMGDVHMGLQARLMSQAMRKFTSVVSRSKCIVIFIKYLMKMHNHCKCIVFVMVVWYSVKKE